MNVGLPVWDQDLEVYSVGVYSTGVYKVGVYSLGVYHSRTTDFGSGHAFT